MTSKYSPTLLLGLVLIGLLLGPASAFLPGEHLAPGSANAAKDYSAEQYDVDLVARADGSLMVTETIVFQFVGGPFTYVFREIPLQETDGIKGISGSMDGVPFPIGEGAGMLEVRGSDRVRVTWRFSPRSDSTHTFVLHYRILGLTRVEEKFDQLRWNAIPFEHPYLIQSSTIRFTYPKRAKLYGVPYTNLGKTRIDTSDTQISFRARALQADQGLQIVVRFTRNSLISQPPEWQRYRAAANQAIARILPWAIATLALLLIAGIGFIYLFWEQNADLDREAEPATAVPAGGHDMGVHSVDAHGVGSPPMGSHPADPPSDLPPAYAGVLVSRNGRPGWTSALATLLDLAQRGVIKIQESGDKGWLRQRDFSISLQEPGTELRTYERGLLDILFQTRRGPRSILKVSELSQILPYKMNKFSEPLRQGLEAAGLLSARRRKKSERLLAAGIVLLLGGLLVFIGSLIGGGMATNAESWPEMNAAAIALSISAGAILISFAMVIVAGLYSPLTEKGLQEAAQWRGYAEYLRDVTRDREPAVRSDLFESALPYAASFGLAESWSKYFQKRGGVRIPDWFHAISTSGDGDGGMAAFVAMLAASHAAGSSSGAGGGTGAGTGGASGAG